jgi:hypothetical protein
MNMPYISQGKLFFYNDMTVFPHADNVGSRRICAIAAARWRRPPIAVSWRTPAGPAQGENTTWH